MLERSFSFSICEMITQTGGGGEVPPLGGRGTYPHWGGGGTPLSTPREWLCTRKRFFFSKHIFIYGAAQRLYRGAHPETKQKYTHNILSYDRKHLRQTLARAVLSRRNASPLRVPSYRSLRPRDIARTVPVCCARLPSRRFDRRACG